MTSFLALYRGRSIGDAKLIAVSAEGDIVADFAERLLKSADGTSQDSVTRALEDGNRQALRLVRDEAEKSDGR